MAVPFRVSAEALLSHSSQLSLNAILELSAFARFLAVLLDVSESWGLLVVKYSMSIVG